MNSARYKIVVLIAALAAATHAYAVRGVHEGAADAAKPAADSTAPAAGTAAPQPADKEAPQRATDVRNAQRAAHAKALAELPPPTEQEIKYGIQIVQIGMSAANGLVDFRFKVLDAPKAKKLMSDPANPPRLVAGDNPPLMPPHKALHGMNFKQGYVNYILYPNARNAIKPGTEVKVAIGEVRFGPVKVH